MAHSSTVDSETEVQDTRVISRTELTPLPAFTRCKIAVGWDSTSATYFAYVLDPLADPPLVLSLGEDIGQVTRPDFAIEAVRPFAVIPADLHAELTVAARPPARASTSVAPSRR